MDKKIKILVVDDEGPPDIVAMVRCFSNTPNVAIHVITTRNWKCVPYRYSRYVKKAYTVPPGDKSRYIERIVETVKKIKPDVLFPATIKAQVLISTNRSAFTDITKVIPLSDTNIIKKVANKWKLNEFLEEEKFPYAKSILFENYQNTKKDIVQLNAPLLLKPLENSGGEGILRFEKHIDLLSYLQSCDISSGSIFFQEYISGPVFPVNILARKGKTLVHSIHKGLVPPLGEFHFSPGIEFINNDELLTLTKQIISKLDYSGVANLDFCYDIKEKNYKLIDFNPRFWSTLLGSHSAGINFPYLTCLTALGIPFASPTYSNEIFLLTKATVRETIKNLTRKEKLAFNFKQTSFNYIKRDPLPEISKIFFKLFTRP